MGMYDTIIGICPKCGEAFEIQTKFSECLLRELTIGDDFAVSFAGDCRIILKDTCQNGHLITIVLRGGKISGFVVGGWSDYREMKWGRLERKGNDSDGVE